VLNLVRRAIGSETSSSDFMPMLVADLMSLDVRVAANCLLFLLFLAGVWSDDALCSLSDSWCLVRELSDDDSEADDVNSCGGLLFCLVLVVCCLVPVLDDGFDAFVVVRAADAMCVAGRMNVGSGFG